MVVEVGGYVDLQPLQSELSVGNALAIMVRRRARRLTNIFDFEFACICLCKNDRSWCGGIDDSSQLKRVREK